MYTAVCLTVLSTASKELLADAVTRPSTNAVIVATSPMPSFTVLLESLSRWCCGSRACNAMPSRTPPNENANTMVPTTAGSKLYLLS